MKNVLSGLTEEEMQMCIQVFQKICNNANECLRSEMMKKIFMLFDKNGSCHHPFFRMLHPGYIVQQEKTNGGSADDPKDMCLHVDDRNGTSVVILDNRKN